MTDTDGHDLVRDATDGELAARAQQLRADTEKLDKLREKYPAWHIFKVAGAWAAVLKAAETARTGNTIGELEIAMLRPDNYATASHLDPDDPQRDGLIDRPRLRHGSD